ncbi:MAG TPA: acyl-CoA dehydrogenase family protein [Microthrixaceae bacterium]|nr:acyl-CoA/acyl-ACP dehydrogenase [Microthrixaceae bacterium]HNI34642.1 acyl-CoA dehydrogenase family protein [Microthrixaceae bacterium]
MTVANAPTWCTGDVERRAWAVGAEVAAVFADEVDRDARFPVEGVDALRSAGLLAAMVPTELGGEGASLASIAGATRALAAHCSATALVMAMHQIEIWYLILHGHTPGLQGLLRSVATDGVLIANANSEVGLGGEVGRSFCAVERTGDGRFHLEKDVLAVSYGANADALLLTARRDPEAAEGEQVMVGCRPGTFRLDQTTDWNTTGLRGTCSASFKATVDEDEEMIFPTPWGTIGAQCIGATTILLNSVWLGIAEAAATRAHAYVRADARRKIGTTPASAPLLAEVSVTLGEARAIMASTIAAYEAAVGTEDLESASLLLAVRNLKLSVTTLAIEIVSKASLICGLAGYKRDSPYSMDRNLRDVLGGPLMANNSRAAGENAQLLLAMKAI